MDSEFIKYYNELTQQEKQNNSAEWLYSRIRSIIYEQFQVIADKEKKLKEAV